MTNQQITIIVHVRQGRVLIVGCVEDGNVSDSQSGIPATHWKRGRELIRLALAEQVPLQAVGARYPVTGYTHDGYALVVEHGEG